MHKRFLIITVVGVALFFSQGGSFLIAALCPHVRSGQVFCNRHGAESTMSEMADDEMGHMKMDSMDESASNPDPNAVGLGAPIGLCPHCAMHSRTVPPAMSLRETEASKRSGTFVIPNAVPQVISVEMPYLAIFSSRAHGPPGQTLPLHVLINIFRI